MDQALDAGQHAVDDQRVIAFGRCHEQPVPTVVGDVELAREAAEQGFAVVAAAGGDGTVHEVANGLLAARRNDSTLAVLPIGSGLGTAYG